MIIRSEPVVQPVPASPPSTAGTEKAPRARNAAQVRPRPAARSAPVALAAAVPAIPSPAGGHAASQAEPVVRPAAAVPAAPTAVPAPIEPAADEGPTGVAAGLLAVLAAAGLAGAGLLAARSRRRRSDTVEEEGAFIRPAPVGAAPDAAPVFARQPSLERFARPASRPSSRPSSSRPSSSSLLPEGPAPVGDARKALLERMVAAEPDEENPFVSRKRRLRRARVLLAQREHGRGAPSGEAFDWRAYRGAPRPSSEAEAAISHPT